MDSVEVFPKDRAACERLQEAWIEQLESFAADNWVEISGANLRREPTQKSDSLGIYHKNIPAWYLGDMKQGTQWPWLHLRIGEAEGWMSAAYVRMEGPSASRFPAKMGRTVNGCMIYRSASESAQSMRLPAGSNFHILAEAGDDWYHICIPRESITWEVDVNGIYAYVRREEVLTGAGLNALDTLERKLAQSGGI